MAFDYINEAFKRLNSLDEELFNTSFEGVKDLSDFMNSDVEEPSVRVIDPDAETEDDLEDSYVGKVITKCNVCHSCVFEDKDDIQISEDGTVNAETACPYCNESEGFIIVGEIAPFSDGTPEVEVDGEKLDVEDSDVELDDTKMTESVRKSRKRKLSESFDNNGLSAKQKLIRAYPGVFSFDPSFDDMTLEEGIFDKFKNKKPKPWSELKATHKLVPTKANNFKVGDWTMTKPDQDINDVTGKALVYPVTGVTKLDSDTVVLKFEGSHGLNTNQNTVLLKAVKNDTVDEEFEVANEEPIEEGLFDGRQTKVGEFEFKYQGTTASTKGISDPEVLAKLYAKRKGLEYGQVYNDLARSNYRDNLFLTSGGVIFKNNKKNTYSITWKDALTNKKITEVVPSQSNFKIEGSDTEVKDILVEILSDYYAQITITGVDNYIGDNGNIEEGLLDKFKKKDVITYSEVENEYSLSNKAAKDLKKGDYVYVEGSIEKGTAKFERVVKIEEEAVGRLNIDTANNVLRSVHEDKKLAIIVPKSNITEDVSVKKSKVTSRVVSEDFKEVSIKTNDQHLEMSSDENGKVSITTEPIKNESSSTMDGEMITSVSDETENAILDNNTDVVEDDTELTFDETDDTTETDETSADGAEEEEVDFDEADESGMDELGESFLRGVYENVNSFKTTSVSTKDNSMIVEGVIKFNSGKTKKTGFIFEAKDINSRGRIRFTGSNKHLTESVDPISLVGVVDNKKLYFESLQYNFKVNNTPVRGLVRRK